MTFLDLPDIDPQAADALVLPIPLEATVSYGRGTAGGPEALLAASEQIELFDEQTGVDLQNGLLIATLNAFQGPGSSPCEEGELADWLDALAARAAELRRPGRLLLGLGGEHLLTLGMTRGLCDDLSRLTVVQLDAHADLIDQLDGRRLSHGTVMRRLWERGARLLQIGVRSLSREEFDLSRDDERIETFFAHHLTERWGELLDRLSQLGGEVYLSIDVDALDPAVIPSTGTPQPGGLTWMQAMAVLDAVTRSAGARLVGADLVEFVPSPHPPGCDLSAAKLAVKLLAFWARGL